MIGKPTVSLCILITLSLFLSSAAGNIVLTDNFNYPDGPLVSVSDGKWKTHSGTAGQVEVVQGSSQLSQRTSEDVSAALAGGPIGPLQSLALYAGFTISFTALPTGANGGYFAHFKDTTPTLGIRGRVFASTNGAAAGKFRLGISAASNNATALWPHDLSLHTPYRVVCRLSLGNASATLWLQPGAETDPATTATDEATPKTAAAFAFRQSLSSGSGMGELTIDNLIVATTFAEACAAATPPTIVAQPEDVVATAGTDVTLRAQASGTPPLSYQWLFNGVELPQATNPALELRAIAESNAGVYEVLVRNGGGVVRSAPATLTVQPAPLTLSIGRQPGTAIQLHWIAQPDQVYSVWVSDSPATESFWPIAGGLSFNDGSGQFDDATDMPVRFYRISCP
jgi:hypothetical protein